MRLGDVNGDGRLDIVTANAGTNTIGVLLNNGNGTFGAPTTFSTPTHPTSIAIGDLNGDGKQDIVDGELRHQQRQRAAGQRQRHVPGRRQLRLRN